MAIEMVNGIPCFNCTDVDRAKKAGANGGADASTTASGAAQAGALSPQEASKPGIVTPIQEAEQGINRPLANGDRGTVFNFAV